MKISGAFLTTLPGSFVVVDVDQAFVRSLIEHVRYRYKVCED